MNPSTISPEVFQIISLTLASIAFLIAYRRFKSNHDWNRRKYAAIMIADWNHRTSEHRRRIEELMPGLVDVNQKDMPREITKKRAIEIYDSNPNNVEDTENWELRFHFIEMLNYFESIASAYHHRVGDREMIEESFKKVLIHWSKILRNFVEIFGEKRGYGDEKPWSPYQALVNDWNASIKPMRRATDSL